MEIKEMREKLSEQAFKLKKARANGTMVMQETERMKNLLVNNCDAIIDALTRVEKLEQEVAVLNMEMRTSVSKAPDTFFGVREGSAG